MRRKFIESPFEFDFEDMERFGRQLETLETEQIELVKEGICDECGTYCIVSKSGKQQLCGSCRKTLTKKK